MVFRQFLRAVMLCLTITAAVPAYGQVLFTEPLHLTRAIDDPISGQRQLVQEYYAGNRMISISGEKVAISDYGKGELTVIDRQAVTWSLTPFEKLAKGRRSSAGVFSQHHRAEWSQRQLPAASIAGRSVDVVEAQRAGSGEIRSIRVAFDRSTAISRSALEVILGVAYPAAPSEVGETIVALAYNGGLVAMASGTASYALPLEVTTTFDTGGEQLVLRNEVLRVSRDLPPAELLSIPAGATRVDFQRAILHEQLEALDRLPNER
jgi:hypothetical protein